MRALSALTLASLLALGATAACAQQKGGGGLVCWKDKSGKVIGCGDKVPPEYQDSASSTLNKQGVTIDQREANLTPEQRRAQAAEVERRKAEAQQRDEEKRRDRVLLDSFTTEKEIDLKRARDIQQLENTISAQQTQLKAMSERQAEARGRIDQLKKENKPVAAAQQQDYDKLAADTAKLQERIVAQRKEIADKNAEYDAMKKRFVELKGGAAPAPAKK